MRHAPSPFPADPDQADLAASLQGDGAAYARLVRRYQAAISRQMWRFCREQTQHAELVQDVFVEAYFSLRTYRAEAPFEHWLRRIAIRAGYAWWRRREKERKTSGETALAGLADPRERDPAEMSPAEAAETVHRALARLPPRDRLVMTLLHLEERSVAEIADLTGWSVSMVKVQAWRARARFRKLLEPGAPDRRT